METTAKRECGYCGRRELTLRVCSDCMETCCWHCLMTHISADECPAVIAHRAQGHWTPHMPLKQNTLTEMSDEVFLAALGV